MAKIGFIGMGNMGYALLKGILRQYSKDDIVFTDVNEERMKHIYNETGVRYVQSNAECANNAKYIIFAVKPQYYDDVISNVKNIIKKDNVIISIAPGITIESLKMRIGFDARIVRAMPNTPALVGEGMTGISYNRNDFEFAEREVIEGIFKSIGKAKFIPENLMSAVTCASGSSPAYVYMFIEALADSVVRCGLGRSDAYEFAAQAVMGSAKLVLETNAHPGILKDMVCSPAGTTIEGVAALEENGFRNAILQATKACHEKAEKIGD